MAKIKLGFYPYTYARVSAMKGMLLKSEDYHKLMKMKLAEITKFLEESDYKREIDELSMHYTGADLLERALNRNLQRAFEKLKRISPEMLVAVIDTYLVRRDVWNIKTILRGKYTSEQADEIKKLLVPLGRVPVAALERFAELDIAEAAKEIGREIPELKEALTAFAEKKDLFAMESTLDHYYYDTVFRFAQSLHQGQLFADFLKTSIDVNNLSMLLRLKREQVAPEKIMELLMFPGYRLSKQELQRFSSMPLEDILSALEKRGMLIRTGKEQESLIEVEVELTNTLLRRAMLLLHQHPLSVDVILGYMLAKDIEIRNLKTLIKGKELAIDEPFIEQALVVA